MPMRMPTSASTMDHGTLPYRFCRLYSSVKLTAKNTSAIQFARSRLLMLSYRLDRKRSWRGRPVSPSAKFSWLSAMMKATPSVNPCMTAPGMNAK